VKFLPTPEDDNIYYEVALAKWLVQIDKNMMGKLLWPDNDSVAGKLVRIEAKADKTWRQLEVEVEEELEVEKILWYVLLYTVFYCMMCDM